MAAIDFKSLLLRYMAHVGECQGDMFLDLVESGQLFTADELAALREIKTAAVETYWPNGSWAGKR